MRVAPYFGITLSRGPRLKPRSTFGRLSEHGPDVSSKWKRFQNYQLDFTTPGISPLSASERKHKRQQPNLRRNARGRPQSWQRLCWRDLNFGTRASLTRFAVVAILLSLFYCKLVKKPVVLSWRRRPAFALNTLTERHAERLQQFACAVVVLRRRNDGDVHALDFVHLRVIDLGEDKLIAQAERVVATAVEALG